LILFFTRFGFTYKPLTRYICYLVFKDPVLLYSVAVATGEREYRNRHSLSIFFLLLTAFFSAALLLHFLPACRPIFQSLANKRAVFIPIKLKAVKNLFCFFFVAFFVGNEGGI
jgi:hypothetical protein